MMKLKNILFVVFLLSSGSTHAQESMMPSVNYVYLEKLVAVARENYPRIKKYAHKLEQANLNLTRTKVGWFNPITLSYTYAPTSTTSTTIPNTNATTTTFAPGLYLNLGALLSHPYDVKMAKEDVAVAREDVEEFNLSLEAQVRERYFTYIEKQAIVNLRTLASNDAETSQKQLKYKFEKGEESFENYSKALVMFSVSTQNKIEAEGAALIAKVSLEEMLGVKLEDIK